MNCFLAADAMVVANNPQELSKAVENLLGDVDRASAMGVRARGMVRAQQGATERHVGIILDTLDSVPTMSRQ
jgi:3-deoxy-D-manno-octulosonic-acid transferase